MAVANTPLTCTEWSALVGNAPTKATKTALKFQRITKAILAGLAANTRSGRPDRVASSLESWLDIAEAMRTKHPEAFAQILARALLDDQATA